MKAKLVEIKNNEQLGAVLSEIFGEALKSSGCGIAEALKREAESDSDIAEELNEKMKDSAETSKACEAIDKLINALDMPKETRLRALSLVLRNETKSEEDSLGMMFEEYKRDMEVIATISQLFNANSVDKLINILSSAASAAAVIGDEVIEKANSKIRVHKSTRCECGDPGCGNLEASENKSNTNADEVIAGILKTMKK